MMAVIVPAENALFDYYGALPLPRYAQIIQQDECAFYGVSTDDGQVTACGTIWLKSERRNIARYLAEAQYEIEKEIGYFLRRRWVTGTVQAQHDLRPEYVDDRPFYPRMYTKWGYLVAAGVRASEVIKLLATVDRSSDPSVVGPLATTVTDIAEIAIYHPGTTIEITPSSITLDTVAQQVTIEIPRCRTVTQAQSDNDRGGIAYTTLSNFEEEVDIYRIYNDPSVNANLVFKHTCSNSCHSSGNACTDTIETGCIYIVDPEVGVIDISRANYSSGQWSSVGSCGGADHVRLNYYSGKPKLTLQAEDAIMRLAHSKMPQEPCGCEKAKNIWKRDREIPAILTRERANCPFGLSNGAWTAWQFAKTMKLWRMKGTS